MAKTSKTDSAADKQPIKVDVKSAPQVNDVAKPGETAATPTSKPIIVGHGSMLKQDPMVSADSSEETNEKKAEKKLKPKPEVKIQPLNENVKAEENPPKSEDPSEQAEDSSSESSEIDALADAAEAKSSAKKLGEEEEQKQAEIKKIIASQKYVVPIIEGGKKASAERIVSWMFLLLLLASIGVVLAIDAGYLNIGIDLPFDYIKN